MLFKKTDQKISGLCPDLLIDIPNGNFVVEINQRSKQDMLCNIQNYLEMDREIAFRNS